MTSTDTSTAPSPRVTPLQVEIWSDVACPWCYIGKRRFAAALADFPHRAHVEVLWRSYQLDPDAEVGSPLTEGQMLARNKGLSLDAVQEMFAHVTEIAAGEGLAYDFDRVRPANTFDAHRLVHLARRDGAGTADRMVEALMSAHFEQGLAIDDRDVLVRIASDLGLDPDRVRDALAGDDAAADVRADQAEARALRVSGVPFFVLDRRYAGSGAQPTALFRQALEQAWSAGER